MASMKKEYDDAVALLKKSKQDNNLKMKALTKKLKLSGIKLLTAKNLILLF